MLPWRRRLGVSIPVLVNLRLGAGVRGKTGRANGAEVSILVLVNLRLGVEFDCATFDDRDASQFLFW